MENTNDTQNPIPQQPQTGVGQDKLSVPAPIPAKQKFSKEILIIIALGLLVAVGSFIYFFALPNNQTLSSRFVNPNPVKQQPPDNNVRYNNSIAQICSKEKKPVGNYAPGEIILKFKDNYSVTQIKKYLADNGYKTADTYSLNEPTDTLIQWTDAFNKQNEITVGEVNLFLIKASTEKYISGIEISSFWHNWPLTKDLENQVQRIDRWGYFTLTFSDPSKEQEFFQKYPEATLYGRGEVQGQYLMREPNVDKVTILYKAKPALDILQAVKNQAQLQDFKVENNLTMAGAESQRQVIFLDDRQRDPTNTTYVSNLGINFSSSLDNDQIRQILESYSSSVDLQKTMPGERLDFFTIQVPTGEEECWSREMSKQPEMESAIPNLLGNLN